MTVKYFKDVVQGSDDWLKLRCGTLTASIIKNIITPTLKVANNDKERAIISELAAQRITKYIPPQYINDDMLRGQEEEVEAKILYAEKYAQVEEVGFITNDSFGYTIGFSPDGLVGEDGFIEIKSRLPKFQLDTIITGEVPEEYILQIQTGFLVSGRKWCDFISYCGGLPMFVKRVYPDDKYQVAILEAANIAEQKIVGKIVDFYEKSKGLYPTERKVEQEIII